MNTQEQNFFDKVSDNFFKFMKTHLPSAATNAAVAATPLIAVAAYSAVEYLIGAITRDPAALETVRFVAEHPNTMTWLSGLKGELPMAAANHSYQFATGALATAVSAGALSKVIEKFSSLRDEAMHLLKENQMLKADIAFLMPKVELVDRGPDANDTLRNRFNSGFGSMQSKLEEREQTSIQAREQATRVTGPKLG